MGIVGSIGCNKGILQERGGFGGRGRIGSSVAIFGVISSIVMDSDIGWMRRVDRSNLTSELAGLVVETPKPLRVGESITEDGESSCHLTVFIKFSFRTKEEDNLANSA